MAFYLGIDIGTSSIKAVLLDEHQHQHASVSVLLEVSRPHAGWSEQDPETWWQGTDSALCQLAYHHAGKMADVRAIGLSGQMHGLVALDKNDAVLRQAILWNDTRASAEAAELDRAEQDFRLIGGNMVMAGFTAPKAMWMARNEPELFAKIKTILLPKDYVRFRLSGEKKSDMSDASGTLWLDIAKRCWSEKLLKICGLSLDQMPSLIEGSEISGELFPELCERWGMKGRVIIAGGAGDNAAAAIGLGLRQAGQSFVSLGTSGVVFSVTDSFSQRAEQAVHAFCHALPYSWHQMGVILSATDSLNWLSEVTGQPVERLLAGMAEEDSDKIWPVFHPYLSGERTPHNDPNAKGGFFGLARHHGVGDMTRAVLQGVALAIGDAREVLDKTNLQASMIATGGGAKNDYWLKLIASVTQCQIAVPKEADSGAALGAARLAMLADGRALDQICTPPDISHIIDPDERLIAPMQKAKQISRNLYKLLSGR